MRMALLVGLCLAVVLNPRAGGAAETPETNAPAQEFLSLLVLDDGELRELGLHTRAGLMQVATFAKAGKTPEAMATFERYFLDKLRHGAEYGLPLQSDGTFAPEVEINPEAALKAADRLLAGFITLDGKEVTLGPPGKVNWNLPFAVGEAIPSDKTPHEALFTGQGMAPLIAAYIFTHDRRYLDAWSAYMDDWARHSTYIDQLHPCHVPSGVNSRALASVLRFTRMLARLASVTTDDPLPIPPDVFARVVGKYLTEFPMQTLIYLRSNTHNWTPFPGLMELALFYEEFKCAPLYFREGRRRMVEDNAVTQNLRDGTENQQCPWYNDNYVKGMARLFEMLAKRDELPSWKERPWVSEFNRNTDLKNEIREHLRDHVTYQIHLRTPQNEWPIPFRGGDKRTPFLGAYSKSPEAYADPENAAILAAVYQPGSGRRPSFDSEWFPYGGYNVVRGGWLPDSVCGALFCSPQPGAYGGYRSRSNNNIFGLGAFGQDLLVDDTTGHYMYPSSPITVDGLNQFFHAKYGIYKVPGAGGHKVYLTSAWTEPAPWRWHASEHFNLMEGIYDGPYAELPKSTGVQRTYGPEEGAQITLALDQTLQGVRHQRLVLVARAAGLWIVTDRMQAAGSHEYEQVWMLPMLPGPYPAFEPDQIHTDVSGKRIFTRADKVTPRSKPTDKGMEMSKANVALHQFTDAALSYAVTQHPRPPIADGRVLMYGWARVGGRWKGEGTQQVVTAIYPQAPGLGADGDLRATKELRSGRNARGFEAATPSGITVRYLAAPDGNDDLDLGTVRIHGEALLLCGSNGIALGCTAMSVGGNAVAVESPDFEFSILNTEHRTLNILSIFRPIDPVTIGPDRNVFTDRVEVTMTSRTPGVQIRYTLDGSDPTPQSAVYSGPITLTGSAVVKARALRPGVALIPPQTSGTLATPVSLAVFDRALPIEAVTVKKTEPGLSYRYFEDDWKRLWLRLDTLQPSTNGVTVGLWDWTVIPAHNAPVSTNAMPRERFFAVEYRGFLNVPADGVYTLHAPREWVMPDTDAGYDLRVELGNRVIPHGYRTRIAGLNLWYPSTRLHALGNWSVALKQGLHPLRIVYIDYRTRAPAEFNRPGLRDYIWSGVTPDLKISGPGFDAQRIPAAWFVREEARAGK
jgi:hypothetical protein